MHYIIYIWYYFCFGRILWSWLRFHVLRSCCPLSILQKLSWILRSWSWSYVLRSCYPLLIWCKISILTTLFIRLPLCKYIITFILTYMIMYIYFPLYFDLRYGKLWKVFLYIYFFVKFCSYELHVFVYYQRNRALIFQKILYLVPSTGFVCNI